MPTLFTIGHSTRSIPEFVDALRPGRVELVVDVRTIPRSRTNPQYNLDALPAELAGYQIGHCRIEALGGLRKREWDVAPEVNGMWRNRSFHNYADYALSDEFAAGLDELLGAAAERATTVMCSEAVWWRCHRSLVADFLKARGIEVRHILSPTKTEIHPYTSAARLKDGVLSYNSLADSQAAKVETKKETAI